MPIFSLRSLTRSTSSSESVKSILGSFVGMTR
jgi:hypothetical protein